MKKIFTLIALAILAASPAAMADADIYFPDNFASKTVKVSSIGIDDYTSPGYDPAVSPSRELILDISNGYAKIVFEYTEPARYSLDFENGESAVFYAAPDDRLKICVVCLNPLVYTVKGTELAQGWTEFEHQARPLLVGLKVLDTLEFGCPVQKEEHREELAMMVDKYMAARPGTASSLAVMLFLDGQYFIDAFTNIAPAAKESFMYPVVKRKYLTELSRNKILIDDNLQLADETEI